MTGTPDIMMATSGPAWLAISCSSLETRSSGSVSSTSKMMFVALESGVSSTRSEQGRATRIVRRDAVTTGDAVHSQERFREALDVPPVHRGVAPQVCHSNDDLGVGTVSLSDLLRRLKLGVVLGEKEIAFDLGRTDRRRPIRRAGPGRPAPTRPHGAAAAVQVRGEHRFSSEVVGKSALPVRFYREGRCVTSRLGVEPGSVTPGSGFRMYALRRLRSRLRLNATLAAWADGEYETFVGFFHPGARGFFLDGGALMQGFNAPTLEAMAQAGFTADVEVRDLNVEVYGSTAVSVAYIEGALTLPGGLVIQGAWRYSETRVETDDDWKVVQFHMSAQQS